MGLILATDSSPPEVKSAGMIQIVRSPKLDESSKQLSENRSSKCRKENKRGELTGGMGNKGPLPRLAKVRRALLRLMHMWIPNIHWPWQGPRTWQALGEVLCPSLQLAPAFIFLSVVEPDGRL